jgi:hypothetical protein
MFQLLFTLLQRGLPGLDVDLVTSGDISTSDTTLIDLLILGLASNGHACIFLGKRHPRHSSVGYEAAMDFESDLAVAEMFRCNMNSD